MSRLAGARTLVSAISWSTLAALIQAISQLVVVVILARLLTPREFGLAALTLTVIALSEIFVQLGVGPALIQRQTISNATIGTAQTITYILGATTTLAIYSTSSLIASFFNTPELTGYIQSCSAIFLIHSLSVVPESMLVREMEFKKLASATCIAQIAGYTIPSIVFAMNGFGAYSLVYATILRAALRTVLLMRSRNSQAPTFNFQDAMNLMHFGAGFSLARVFNYCANQADKVVIGKTLGITTLGIYDRARYVIELITMFVTKSIDQALFSAMSATQDNTSTLRLIFLRSLTYTLYFTIPIGVFLAINAHYVIEIVLGKQWAYAAPILAILALSLAPRIAYRVSDSLCRATGAVYQRAAVQALFASSVAIFTYIGHNHGAVGAATGAAIAICTNYVLMLALSTRITHCTIQGIISAHAPGMLTGILYMIGGLSFNAIFERDSFTASVTVLVQAALLLIAQLLSIYLLAKVFKVESIVLANRAIWSRIARRNPTP